MASSSDNKSSTFSKPTTISAGLSTALIGVIPIVFPNASKEICSLASAVIPFTVTGIVALGHWLFVAAGLLTTEEMVADRRLSKQIKVLRKEIEVEKKAQRNVSALESKLHDTIIARTNLYNTETGKSIVQP